MTFRRNFDLLVVAAVIAGFVFVAAERLATVPVYETDEAMTLQVPYEMLYRGKLAMPMWRYLGGNIENVWHSYTPVYFVLLSGFLKVFGFGVLQGRVFNLITVVATLLMVYLIARRLFDWRVGLIALMMIVSDQTVLERSRLLRNDYAPAAFALLAFYLYLVAAQRRSTRFYIASGLAAGAGVMCHTNALYMLGAICLLILLREGLRAFTSKTLYVFAGSAFVVMAYEVIYDIIDYKNFLLQNRGDQLHYGILSLRGWWDNFLDEPRRYIQWYNAYDVAFPNVPRTLLHLFQFLTVVALIYLIARCARYIKRRTGSGGDPVIAEPRALLLLVTVVAILFFATLIRKLGSYNAHLVTWFALCVGVLLGDGFQWITRLRLSKRASAKLAYRLSMIAVALTLLGYAYLVAKQNYRYIREVRNPDLASFDEMKGVLRDIVPEEVCPVAVKAPIMWLAFPEKDRCFATLEHRMSDAVDIEGRDYALIVRPKSPDHWAWDLDETLHLLGEMDNTPYGNFMIYYTGVDPRYLALTPRHYYFLRRWRGHATGEQLAAAREVWSADAIAISNSTDAINREALAAQPAKGKTRADALLELCSMELKPETIYQVVMDTTTSAEWELVMMDEKTGRWMNQIEFGAETSSQRVEGLFRTSSGSRIKLAIRPTKQRAAGPIHISRISIREVAQV
ncbi:MAG: glycosyltransferase family 39 protein [Acidobacteriota bacterium]